MQRKYFLFLFFLLSSSILHSQNLNCSSDEFNLLLKEKNLTSIEEENYQKTLYNYLTNSNTNARTSDVPLIVPVVVHVIHQNGPENLSDEQIINQINALNNYFGNSGAYYNPAGVDVGIQFCLASVDPYGNPTSGITRNVSPYAVVDLISNPLNDINMKNVNRWNPYRYLNIWIVKDVLGFSNAYSTLPISIGSVSDGIVIVASTNYGNNSLFSHEAGHYLGLNHHFVTGNCVNFNCLLDGDNICDTPPELPNSFDCTISTCATDANDTLGLSPFTSDVPDKSTLMTAKANCDFVFTQGQADRMLASLTQIRTLLLSSNGCGANNVGTIPIASFEVEEFGCNATSVDYTGTAYEYLEWDVTNDGYFEHQQDSFGFLPTQTELYTIVVRAFGSAGADIDTQIVYIYARPTTIYPLQSTTGGIVPSGVCQGSTVTFTAVPGMASYLWSNGDTTQSTTYVADSSFFMTLTCIDTTGYVWQRCPNPTVFYNIVEAPSVPVIYSVTGDSLCFSDTLAFTVDLQPNEHIVYWSVNGFFAFNPADTFYIYNPFTANNLASVVVSNSNFCNVSSNPTIFYTDPVIQQPYIPTIFDYTLYATGGSEWNHKFYFNGVEIPGTTPSSLYITIPGCYSVKSWKLFEDCATLSDTVCLVLVGNEEQKLKNTFSIYPSPTANNVDVLLNNSGINNEPTKIEVVDMLGKILSWQMLSQQEKKVTIDLSNFADGIYFIKVNYDSKKVVKKS
jgi:hypothetical protein